MVKLGTLKKDIHNIFDNILNVLNINDDEKFFLFDSKQKEKKLESYENNQNPFAGYIRVRRNSI